FTEIKQSNSKLSNHWLKFRTKKKRGGIWLPLKLYQPIPEESKLKDSLLKWNEQKQFYEVRLVYEKEVPIQQSFSNILAIDLGEKVMATVCGSWNKKPLFLGREIRGIRRHYSWLRKNLGKAKQFKKIIELKNKEKKQIETVLHEISKKIVTSAHKHKATIFLGDLKGIRQSSKNKGRRFRRIVSNFPYYKLTQMITYKANWLGIQVIKINERNTSKTCSNCNQEGKRINQGLFKCPHCNYQVNADFNASKNILKRSEEYISSDGAKALALNPSPK
ncbi:MAG: transposase, partial [Nanoarchaeota archaeon]